ncbi:MAG TPA: DEAD/DEAH box helicase [Chlamydiales bacterium]|nr:DEAD/DEAH box helicase [Chlamydiales bacterium]
MSDFEEFELPRALIESLKGMQITTPTPIQKATIPIGLKGQDILASAQTGSGKTIAYAIPLIVKLLQTPHQTALILTPTRELATQVHQCLNLLAPNFKTALLIGGAPMFRQMTALRKKPQFIVGTPGRITDHLLRGSLSLKETRFLVVDEADRMLDMGFGIQLDKIAEFLPPVRQTLMFSATLPPNIHRLSQRYLRDPQRISIESTVQTAPKIKQEIIRTTNGQKFNLLLDQLNLRQGSILIFAKTRRSADHLARELKTYGHNTNAIHGDLSQGRRDSVIRSFRNNAIRILVATDIAARGLDIPQIMHVINYDLPQCPEDYIHRIGRTARAGAEGNALCFLSPGDNGKWNAISRLMNPDEKFSNERPSGQFDSRKRKPFQNRRRRPSSGGGNSFSKRSGWG